MAETEIIFGPPGTGKTTKLLSILESELAAGVPPNAIGFFTFTKKAALEAKERALHKFPHLDPVDFGYFRTLHSLAFRSIGGTSGALLKNADYKAIGQKLGLECNGKSIGLADGDTVWMGAGEGDQAIFLENLARIRMEPLKVTWEVSNSELDWRVLEQFTAALNKYKADNLMMDFTDMLSKFVAAGRVPHLPVVFIDEAQDLSKLQWKLVELLANEAERVYVAGDDDQAIFRWAGADVQSFIRLPGNRTVLDKSYRVPQTVHDVALWVKRGITGGVPKDWHAREDKGSVEWEMNHDIPELGEGTWLLLGRNNYNLKPFIETCVEAGYPFDCHGQSVVRTDYLPAIVTWERLRKGKACPAGDVLRCYDLMRAGDGYARGNKRKLSMCKELVTLSQLKSNFGLLTDSIWHEALTNLSVEDRGYFLRALRRGEKLTGVPRIRIATIHGAKGGEADNVMLCTDMSYKNLQTTGFNSADESRVWYVGVTRAKKNLRILHPSGNYFFDPLSQATLPL